MKLAKTLISAMSVSAVFGFASLGFGSLAQASEVTANTWIAYSHDQDMNEKISIHFDGIARQTADFLEHRQNILRGSVLVEPLKHFKVGVGYAHQNTENWNAALETPSNEDRIYEELSYKHEVSGLDVDHRVRFEQRFRESRVNGASTYQNRVRYQAKLKVPVGVRGRYIMASDEIFFQSADGSPTAYGQNRFLLGVGIPLAEYANTRLEAGWMWQDNPPSSSTPAFTVHLLQFSFYTAGSFL